MKITHTRIAKLFVQDIEGLTEDLSIVLESTGPKRGIATVRYGGYDWNSFWNAMPQDSIIEFFAKAPCDYLLDNMSRIVSHKADYNGLKKKALAALLKLRRQNEISQDVAKEHYTKIRQMGNPEHCSESMTVVFGADDWWHCIDSIVNPEYVFATKVMAAAQDAVRQAIASGDLKIE